MRLPALWAAAGATPAPSFSKDIATVHAPDGDDLEPQSLGVKGACNVIQVRIDILFRYPQGLGEVAVGHLTLFQELYHALAQGLVSRTHDGSAFPLETDSLSTARATFKS